MKWQHQGNGRWYMLAGLALTLLALLAACGGSGGNGGNASTAATDTKAQTAAATIIGGQGATVVAGATSAASAISQIQTAAPGINATVTAAAGLATAFAPGIPSPPGGIISTAAASTAVIPTVPQATFVSGIQTAASATSPTVRILAPVPNSSIPGSAGIGASYLVTGGVTLPLTADANTPVTGTHVAVVLDDAVTAGKPIPSDARHVHTLARTATLKDVTPGQHTLRVVLVDDKNVPLPNAEAQASVTFTTT